MTVEMGAELPSSLERWTKPVAWAIGRQPTPAAAATSASVTGRPSSTCDGGSRQPRGVSLARSVAGGEEGWLCRGSAIPGAWHESWAGTARSPSQRVAWAPALRRQPPPRQPLQRQRRRPRQRLERGPRRARGGRPWSRQLGSLAAAVHFPSRDPRHHRCLQFEAAPEPAGDKWKSERWEADDRERGCVWVARQAGEATWQADEIGGRSEGDGRISGEIQGDHLGLEPCRSAGVRGPRRQATTADSAHLAVDASGAGGDGCGGGHLLFVRQRPTRGVDPPRVPMQRIMASAELWEPDSGSQLRQVCGWRLARLHGALEAAMGKASCAGVAHGGIVLRRGGGGGLNLLLLVHSRL